MSELNQPKGGQGQVLDPETFRDTINTVDRQGKRKWVYPKKPKGQFTNYREIVSIVLLITFFVIPFIKINGNPLLLINILEREFFIFGKPFYPQDFFILALGAITSIVFIILFTVVFGRIFCGWVCPQTIFLEMIFRKIEYAIEGDRNKQIRLDSQPWTTEKIAKRVLKWTIYAIISLVITHFMFMFIVGYEEVYQLIKQGPLDNGGSFIAMLLFTGAFYFVFAWFREQVCILVCPYGRLQGVLIDKETINVFYDFKRGEGRAKWRKGEDRKSEGKGDCIDCNQCVVVCPTGIDIRNGQQLECVNCTACIDACDEVMVKTGLPKGLIRYATQNEIEKEIPFKFTNRMKAYSVVLLLLMGFLAFLLNNRGQMEAKFLKLPGDSFVIREGKIINTYNYTLLNKTNEKKKITIKVLSPKNGEISYSGNKFVIVDRDQLTRGTIHLSFPEKEISNTKQSVKIGIFDEKGDMLDDYETVFEGPFQINF